MRAGLGRKKRPLVPRTLGRLFALTQLLPRGRKGQTPLGPRRKQLVPQAPLLAPSCNTRPSTSPLGLGMGGKVPGKTPSAEQREETPGVCPPSRGGRPELGGERPPEPGRTGQGGGSGHKGLHCGGTWLPGRTEPCWPGFGYPGSRGEGCGETRPMKQDGAATLPASPAAEGAQGPAGGGPAWLQPSF